MRHIVYVPSSIWQHTCAHRAAGPTPQSPASTHTPQHVLDSAYVLPTPRFTLAANVGGCTPPPHVVQLDGRASLHLALRLHVPCYTHNHGHSSRLHPTLCRAGTLHRSCCNSCILARVLAPSRPRPPANDRGGSESPWLAHTTPPCSSPNLH